MGKKLYANVYFCVLLMLCGAKVMAGNYYWVGGSGNWSDYGSHWATTSGGNVFQPQVPQSTDHVFFDTNSFTGPGQVVSIDQTIVNCNDMNWTGATNNPTLSAGGNDIYVYGSFTLIPAMDFFSSGFIYLQATTPGKTITTAGHNILVFSFEGDGGVWTLQDSLNCMSMRLHHGTLNTNNYNISCSTFESQTSDARGLILGSSTIHVVSQFYFSGGNATLDAGTSHIKFYDSGGNGTYFLCDSANYYDLTMAGNSKSVLSCGGVFHNVWLNGDNDISGNNTFNNLNLVAGKAYGLRENYTQTILGSLNVATSGCGKLAYVQSQTAGVLATVRKASGTITATNLFLKDVKATGGATFTANNSIDGGNNPGWTINTISAQNLYWIGNSGNWSDGSHWSLSSGGAPSGCVPTPADNVFFDANSFTAANAKITLDATGYCNNMNWTGALNNPRIDGPYNTPLYIYGSLVFVKNMLNNLQGIVSFKATTPQTITSASQSFKYQASFDGIGGSWTLVDSLTAFQADLQHGTLNTNGQNMNLTFFTSANYLTGRTLNLSTSTITLTNAWNVDGALILDAGTSHLVFTNNTVSPITYPYFGGLTYYDATFTGPLHTTQLDRATFHNVVIAGHAIFYGNITYNDLTLSPGKTYSIAVPFTQTINGNLNAVGTCGALIAIKSFTAGTQVNIKKTSGTITADYVFITDIKASGGATFTANNSVNGGNNSGWVFNASTPKNLYWVGGTGNWGDGNHWSLSSGGAGSGCIPTSVDNVFFDAVSFTGTGQTVTINIATAYCANMDWTGATYSPSLAGISTNKLQVYGSFKLVPALNFTFDGTVYFSATTGTHTITSLYKLFRGGVYFSGLGGTWGLQDSMQCKNLTLVHGTFNTNNQTIRTGNVLTEGSSGCTFNMGASVIYITTNCCNGWSIYYPITINPGTSHIIYTDMGGNPGYFYGGGKTYYDLTFRSGISGSIDGSNTFHDVTFTGNANFTNGSNQFHSLFFYNPGRTVTVANGATETIDAAGQLYAIGNPGFPIRIQSASAGGQHTFFKSAGTVCLDYLRMSDSKATGGAIFNAGANSEDLGNNTGWSFTGGGGGNASVDIAASEDTVCAGVPVTFTATNNSGGSATYNWLVNGTLKQSGASNTYTSSGLSNSDAVIVVMNATAACLSNPIDTSDAVAITVGGGADAGTLTALHDSVCVGNNETISVAGNTAAVNWESSTDGNTYGNLAGASGTIYAAQMAQTTWYRVVAGTGGCADTSNVLKLVAKELPVVPDLAADNLLICSGDSTQICAASGFTAYQWNGGATTQCVTAKSAGGYWVTVTGSNGCAASSAHANLGVRPIPSVSVIVKGDTLSSFGAEAYQWYKDGTAVNGATTNIYVTQQSGFYSVEVVDANGCKATSTPVYIGITGIGGEQEASIHIYPNPAYSEVFVEMQGQDLSEARLLDMVGREIIRYIITGTGKTALNISALSPGMYQLVLYNNGLVVSSSRLMKGERF